MEEGECDFTHSLTVQSDSCIVPDPDQPDDELEYEIEQIDFIGSDANQMTGAPPIDDPTITSDGHSNALLADFLSRPVEINTFEWSTADTNLGGRTFEPWHLFLNNATIKRKVDNYKFITGNLHLKFVINATNMLAGLARVTYHPLAGLTPDSVPVLSSSADLIPLSQRPYVDLFPQENSAGEIMLPYFYYKNWLDLTSAQDLKDMGEIRPILIASLIHAQNLASTITVTCYAWMENVQIAGPTHGLAVQSSSQIRYEGATENMTASAAPAKKSTAKSESKSETKTETKPEPKPKAKPKVEFSQPTNDEYGQGPVQKTATAIAGIGAAAAAVPVLAPFATATAAVATGVSWVASLFGWTNVPVIDDVRPYKSLTHHTLASAFIGEPVEKLTLDPKNELTVDPRTVGLDGTDELAISNIVERESFLTQTLIDGSMTAGTVVMSAGVAPFLWDIVDNGLDTEAVYSTPMGHLQHLFNHWHGDLIFTFQFIHTKFHKGRLRITWDPSADIVTNSDTTTTSITKIIDLGQSDKVELRVPYLQATPWLDCRKDLVSTPLFSPNTISSTITDHNISGATNGTISVRVLNPITGPASPTYVGIVMYVRAAENFRFGNPRSELPQHSVYEVQSSEVIKLTTLDTSSELDKFKSLICMGEDIRSLRTLLRRSTLSSVYSPPLSAGDWNVVHNYMTPEPLYYGYDPNGLNSATGIVSGVTENFNFVQVTPYNWIAPLFIGRRGSMFWHFNADGTGEGADYLGTLRVHRRDRPISTASALSVLPLSKGTTSSVMRAFNCSTSPDPTYPRFGSGAGGQALTAQQTQAGMSVAYPMYAKNKMYLTDWTKTTLGSTVDGSAYNTFDVNYIVRNEADNGNQQLLLFQKYSSIGTDFNFFYFINVPVFYTYNQAVPAAA